MSIGPGEMDILRHLIDCIILSDDCSAEEQSKDI